MAAVIRALALLLCLVTATGCGSNPAGPVNRKAPAGTGFVLRTYKLSNGDNKKCSVFVPFSYDARKKWPAIVFLQGLGEGGSDGIRNTTVGLGPAIAKRPDKFDFIAIFPQSGGYWRSDDSHQMALDCLKSAEKEYSIDASRIYLTGLSTGGEGVWLLAARNRGRFAAIVPVCAYSGEDVARKLTSTPVWAFHNSGDPLVWASSTKDTVKKINKLGGNAKQTIYNAIGHDCWGRAYSDPSLFAWLQQQRLASTATDLAAQPTPAERRPAGH
jgi:predicted peptidase